MFNISLAFEMRSFACERGLFQKVMTRKLCQNANFENGGTTIQIGILHILLNILSILLLSRVSDFIWLFLRPYMGVIPNPKMAFIFPISCILALIFPIFINYFPKYEGKGSFPKSQIKSLRVHSTSGYLEMQKE